MTDREEPAAVYAARTGAERFVQASANVSNSSKISRKLGSYGIQGIRDWVQVAHRDDHIPVQQLAGWVTTGEYEPPQSVVWREVDVTEEEVNAQSSGGEYNLPFTD